MIVKYHKEETASGGAISFNTDDIRGVVYRILVKPLTSTITYDLTITDDNSLVVYGKNGIRGTLNDLTQHTLKGIHTVAVANTSVNELFEFQIEYEEIM